MTREDRAASVLYLSVAFAVGFVDFTVRQYQAHPVTEYIPGVLAGTYGAPAIYRVLAPYLIDAFNRLSRLDPLTGFLLLRVVFIYAALVITHAYLRVWYSAAASTGGTLALVAMLPLTFTNSYAHPDSFPELVLFTLGCLLIARQRDLLFFVVLVLATLNRETAVFLVLVWACDRLPGRWGRADIARAVAFGLTWLAIYAGVRWLRGFQHYQYWMLDANVRLLKPLPEGYPPYKRLVGCFWVVLLAPSAWLAVRGARMSGTPAFMLRTLPVAALFFVVCFTISTVSETRIFLPMFPLLLPAAVRVFAQPVGASQPAVPAC